MCYTKVLLAWTLGWHVFEGFVIPQTEGIIEL